MPKCGLLGAPFLITSPPYEMGALNVPAKIPSEETETVVNIPGPFFPHAEYFNYSCPNALPGPKLT